MVPLNTDVEPKSPRLNKPLNKEPMNPHTLGGVPPKGGFDHPWIFPVKFPHGGFQSMEVPLFIIHFRLGFSNEINHPAMYPHDYGNPPYFPWLVVWHIWITFSIQLGMSSSQLTFTPSFFRGVGQQGTPMTMETHHIMDC